MKIQLLGGEGKPLATLILWSQGAQPSLHSPTNYRFLLMTHLIYLNIHLAKVLDDADVSLMSLKGLTWMTRIASSGAERVNIS